MASRPIIFFNFHKPLDPQSTYCEWRDERGRTEEELQGPIEVSEIKQAFLRKGMPEGSSFDITVSNPAHLIHWLRINDATQLSRLNVFSSATDIDDDARVNPFRSNSSDVKTSEWQRLFEMLATDRVAPNLKSLEVFWDCADHWRGLGKSVGFVRALAKLRPKEHVKVSGFYASNWPYFLEREMGVPVIVEEQPWRAFQRGTEGLVP